MSVKRTNVRTIGRGMLHQDDVHVRAGIGRRHQHDAVGNGINGGIGGASLANIFGEMRAAVNIPIVAENLPKLPSTCGTRRFVADGISEFSTGWGH